MSLAKCLYLVDLDRTVFRTDEHFDDFCTLVSTKYGVEVQKLREHERQLTAKPATYSPLDDLRYSNGNDIDIDELNTYTQGELAKNGKDYLYDDVEEFLRLQREKGNPVALITMGTHEYQEHKRRLAPLIVNLPMIVTREPKSHVLSDKLSFKDNQVSLSHEGESYDAKSAMLIDDRAGTFDDDMPDTPLLELVRIKREGAMHAEQPTPPGIREISSLLEVVE